MCGFKAKVSVFLMVLASVAINSLNAQILTNAAKVVASDPSATEGADSGAFTITRQGDTNFPLRVFFTLAGTAMNGADYQSVETSILIPPGERSAKVEIVPIDDNLVETNERVVLRLTPSPLASPGTSYAIIAPVDAFVTIYDNDTPKETNRPPVVRIASPTNSASFTVPTNIWIFAEPNDPDGTVETVEFFADSKSLGIVTNNPIVMTFVNPWNVLWTNVPPGSHVLHAVATDDKGARGSSAPVTIFVRAEVTNTSPVTVTVVATDREALEIPVVPPGQERPQLYDPAVFTISRTGDTNIPLTVYYTLGGTAKNGTDYESLPGSVTIPAGVTSATVEVSPIDDTLVEGDESVELIIQAPMCIAIYPPPPECYRAGSPNRAFAVIHDDDKAPATNRPPYVKIVGPADGSNFRAPATIFLQASAADPDGFISSVAFYEGTNLLGKTSLSNTEMASFGPSVIYSLVWSNVPAGAYVLTAKATDNQDASSISPPVRITVGTNSIPEPSTNKLPVVSIYAEDAYAAEGTNSRASNTAIFVVRRQGPTNTSLVVFYAASGMASNGVDYTALPGTLTIPAGERSARITVTAVDDAVVEPTESLVIALQQPPFASLPTYDIGLPGKAAGFIVDNDGPPPPTCKLADGLFHLCRPGTNGWPYRLECSTDMTNWITLYTNRVVDGAIHFVEPDTATSPKRFYRILPELTAPAE